MAPQNVHWTWRECLYNRKRCVTVGLFGFGKKKAPPALPELSGQGPATDYVFAHIALRQMAVSQPLRVLAIAGSDKAYDFLSDLLKDVEEQCGQPATYAANEIQLHHRRIGNSPGLVVEFPHAKEMAEAHMVAIVALMDLTSDQEPDFDSVKGRYFTLEKGITMSDEPRTVLAEWDTTAHMNYGDGPPCDVEQFVAAISQKL